jgi:hypothetical protein
MSVPVDPVLDRRARIARAVAIAKRVGYVLLLGAVVLFGIALATDFPEGLVTATIVSLIAACIVLPVPIVLGYGLNAAAREDRALGIGGAASAGTDPAAGGATTDDQQ